MAVVLIGLLSAACDLSLPGREDRGGTGGPAGAATAAPPSAAVGTPDDGSESDLSEPIIVVAPGVRGIDEALIRDAFRQVLAQADRDFGMRPQRPVTIYIDPDSAAGLEDAIGLSQKSAIHLRAGHARSLQALLPLLLHEYTHTLQYQAGRLRPQWWVEGQADHESLRIKNPGDAQQERRSLYRQLAADVKGGKAPDLTALRGSIAWDDYIKKAGASKAYGWGNAAVHFIESRAGFEGVRAIMTDHDGPNTLGRFDQLVEQLTGVPAAGFDAAVKQWVVEQARS